MIGLPSHQTWDGWVPPTLRTVGAIGTPKGQKWKVSYISSVPVAHAQQAPANTTPTVGPSAMLIKISTDIGPILSPFYKRENAPNFGPNYDPNRLRTAVFLNCGILSEIRNTLGKNRR